MNIYKIEQSVNNGYDTYDSAVVAAPDEETARNIHPGGPAHSQDAEWGLDLWAPSEHVKVTFLGIAAGFIEPGVIVSSFNAG